MPTFELLNKKKVENTDNHRILPGPRTPRRLKTQTEWRGQNQSFSLG